MINQPRVETSPQRAPGCCISCRAGSQADRKWFLDTDLDESDSPMIAIILCDICFTILAGTCGFEPIGKMAQGTRNRIEELERQNNEFRDVDSTLRFFGLDLDHLTNLRARSEMADGNVLPSASGTGDEESSEAPKTGRGKKGPAESTDVETVGDVRASKPVTLSI